MKSTLLAQSLNFYEEANTQDLPGVPSGMGGNASLGFSSWVSSLLSGIMVLAILMVFLYLVWGAIEWITSGGDSSKTSKARDKMTQAVIGLIVLSASTALLMLIQRFLGIRVIEFNSIGLTIFPSTSPTY